MPSPLSLLRRVSSRSVSSPTACGRCGAPLEAKAWCELELLACVAPERVRELVTSWPDDTSIEVRRCACGCELARKATTVAMKT
jgi:hypothetical protein